MELTAIDVMQKLGLPAFLTFVVAAIAWFVLKRTFQQHDSEREIWRELMGVHFEKQSRASDYQRNEHTKILGALENVEKGMSDVASILRKMNGK